MNTNDNSNKHRNNYNLRKQHIKPTDKNNSHSQAIFKSQEKELIKLIHKIFTIAEQDFSVNIENFEIFFSLYKNEKSLSKTWILKPTQQLITHLLNYIASNFNNPHRPL